jgi:endoglucanase
MIRTLLYGFTGALATTIALSATTPVEKSGAMAVAGNKIVGKDGKPVQVTGMSLYWSVWGGEDYYNKSAVDWLVKDWKINLIRAAIAAEPNDARGRGYMGDPAGQLRNAKTVVDAAIANGIYVIVDWHDHNANKHVKEAKAFFEEMGKAYGNTPNVIWEIWNEPDNRGGSGPKGEDTWDDIRGYAAEVIPVIRKHSSNVIVVGTPTWSQDVDIAAAKPIAGPNIAYALHFYAGTHGASLRTKAEKAMQAGAAIFITEYGTTHADGGTVDRKVYTEETKVWLDWADKYGLSYTNWSLVDKDESSAAFYPGVSGKGGWSPQVISTSGKWVRDRLLARAAAEAPAK